MLPRYTPITCQTACHYHAKPWLPFKRDLNVYRGCIHGCKYCYALYSHKYMEQDNFYENIFVKTNIISQLEKQLSNSNWKREVINLGGVTDNYQSAETHYKYMPEIWKLLIKYKTPATISTKSNLILRDIDLIDQLSHVTSVNVALTITTTDPKIQKLIEPNASPSQKRFETLKAFSKTWASRGVHLMPIIPYLTDSKKNIESIYANAKNAKVQYVLPGTMYLRGKTRTTFFTFIKKEFPHLYDKFKQLYQTGGVETKYKDSFYQMLNQIRNTYQIPSGSKERKEMKAESKYQNQRLF